MGHPFSAHILVVEDPFVRTFLRTVLQRQGHSVVTGDAAGSCDQLNDGRMTPDIVITNRPEAFLEFATRLPLLYLASCPDEQLAARFAHCRILQKPFRNEELLAAVEQLACCVVP